MIRGSDERGRLTAPPLRHLLSNALKECPC
jgi:hypothetical protein